MLNRFSFEELKGKIAQRLSYINYEADRYTLKINCKIADNNQIRVITVSYDNKKIARFNYFVSNVINPDGSRTVKGAFTIRRKNESEWYDGVIQTVHVDEFFRCGYKDNQSLSLDDELNKVLPLSDENKVYQIKTSLEKEGFDNLDIKFDTLRKRYIVIGDLSHILGLVEDDKSEDKKDFLYLYKYMSLDTYFSMLMNKTFRMNSILAMNDESESFFLDEDLFDIYSGKGVAEKYNNVIQNSRTLISSFTNQGDSGLMWRLYGENGRGICLGFEVPKNKIKKIHYLSELNAGYSKLKNCVNDLLKEGISIYFKDANQFKYYTKSDGFRYEEEYRLSYTAAEEELAWAKYGNILSPYRDFSFIKNRCELIDIKLFSVWIGAKLPNFDVNYPLLVELTNKHLHTNIIYISKQNKFRE